MVADVLSWKGKVDKGEQVARLSAMSVEIVKVNPTEQITGLLVNLVILNDLMDHVKLERLT